MHARLAHDRFERGAHHSSSSAPSSSAASRSRSAITSACVILRSAIVRRSARTRRPRGAKMRPTAPSTQAIRKCAARRENATAPVAHARAPRISSGAPAPTAASARTHDVGIEHREQRVEVAVARGGEKRVDHLALPRDVGVWGGVASRTHAAARAARELARRGRRAADDRRDLVERHRRTGRAARTRGARPASACRARRAARARPSRRAPPPARDRRRSRARRCATGVGRAPRVERLLAPRLARAQHVEAHARDDRRQPAAEVLDVGRVGAAEAQPRLLHRVVGLAQRAEHPVGHRPQVRPRCSSNSLGQPFARRSIGHILPSSRPSCRCDGRHPANVTEEQTTCEARDEQPGHDRSPSAMPGAAGARQPASRQGAACPSDHARPRPPARQPDQRLQRLRRHARPRPAAGAARPTSGSSRSPPGARRPTSPTPSAPRWRSPRR